LVTLVVRTSKADTLFEHMHELGTAFFCKEDEDYYVVYYATNRQVYFKGKLTEDEAQKLKDNATEVKSIEYDKFKDELLIEE